MNEQSESINGMIDALKNSVVGYFNDLKKYSKSLESVEEIKYHLGNNMRKEVDILSQINISLDAKIQNAFVNLDRIKDEYDVNNINSTVADINTFLNFDYKIIEQLNGLYMKSYNKIIIEVTGRAFDNKR